MRNLHKVRWWNLTWLELELATKLSLAPLSNVDIRKSSLWGDLPRANPAWETNIKLLRMEITFASLSLGLIPLIGSCGYKSPGWHGVSVWVLCYRVVFYVFLRHNSPLIPSIISLTHAMHTNAFTLGHIWLLHTFFKDNFIYQYFFSCFLLVVCGYIYSRKESQIKRI